MFIEKLSVLIIPSEQWYEIQQVSVITQGKVFPIFLPLSLLIKFPDFPLTTLFLFKFNSLVISKVFFKCFVCLCALSEKCAQTLVLCLILSSLMEARLPLDSSVFFSSFCFHSDRLLPEDGAIEQVDMLMLGGVRWIGMLMVSLFPTTRFSSRSPSSGHTHWFLLLLDGDWCGRMWLWLMVVE